MDCEFEFEYFGDTISEYDKEQIKEDIIYAIEDVVRKNMKKRKDSKRFYKK